MTEWTFHDNRTWLDDLDQPPELLMSRELRNLEAQALMGETRVVGRPPPKPPDVDSETLAGSGLKSGIHTTSSIL